MNAWFKAACVTLLALAPGAGAQAAGKAHFADRPEVTAFAQELEERHQIPHAHTLRLLRHAVLQTSVLRAIAPPADPQRRSWADYRALFVNPDRIDNGLAFWDRHAGVLTRAHTEFGVPPEIVVAIIGIESQYGRNAGNYRVLDALATLAFDYPPRAEFFRSELEQFLLLARELRVDPFSIKGSYAGAIGIPQFMPGSIRRYAVDFSGDGKRDVAANVGDAIGSVGNFLARHGWVRDLKVMWRAEVAGGSGASLQAALDAGVKPQFKLNDLLARGVIPDAAARVPDELPLALIDLPSRAAPNQYRLGSENFFVITRYNRSSFYASAAAELAEALRNRRDAQQAQAGRQETSRP